jgi:hypothetical protein
VSRGEATCRVDVPQWDFDYQAFYRYTETVSGSDQGVITYTWTTQDRDDVVILDDGTEDEMCLVFFYMTEPGSSNY